MKPAQDKKRPWELAFRKAVEDSDFWLREFERLALKVLTPNGGLAAFVQGDAPVGELGVDVDQHLSGGGQSSGGGGVPSFTYRPKGAPHDRGTKRQLDREPEDKPEFDEAIRFWVKQKGTTCEKKSDMRHQCKKCLQNNFGWSECNQNLQAKAKAAPKSGSKKRGGCR